MVTFAAKGSVWIHQRTRHIVVDVTTSATLGVSVFLASATMLRHVRKKFPTSYKYELLNPKSDNAWASRSKVWQCLHGEIGSSKSSVFVVYNFHLFVLWIFENSEQRKRSFPFTFDPKVMLLLNINFIIIILSYISLWSIFFSHILSYL